MTQSLSDTAPNILFILMDDLGQRDLGTYGSSFYETPRLDQLREEGMLFTDAYAACPVCSPTRASILTGKYPANVNITNFIPGNNWGKLMGVPYFHQLPKTETTLAQALKSHGYQTWHIGKWHLGPKGNYPEDFGFDLNIGGKDWGMPMNGYFAPWGIETLSEGDDGDYLTDRLTTEAIQLIESGNDHSSASQPPWFMYLSHYAVHTPIQAPADLIAKYEAKAKAMGIDQDEALVEGERMPYLNNDDRRVVRRQFQSDPAYAAMIENMDTNVGRVLDALDATGQRENTIVIFTSDNGGLSTAEGSPTCNLPLAEGKGWMYDGGIREPLLIRWPDKVQPNTTCNTPVTSPDFFPTLLDAAQLPLMPEHHEDGESLLPLLLNPKTQLQRDAIYWHYPHYSNQGGSPACAVRCGNYKLIEHFETSPAEVRLSITTSPSGTRLELFNLIEDIEENHDLAAREPDQTRSLYAKLIAWRESIEAKIPDINPWYDAMESGDLPKPDGRGRFADGTKLPPAEGYPDGFIPVPFVDPIPGDDRL